MAEPRPPDTVPQAGLDYSELAATPWTDKFAGHARYNFINGCCDRSLQPLEQLADCAAEVLRREESRHQLAVYWADGFQGYLPLREQVVAILATGGVYAKVDDVMITGGSNQALHLVFTALCKEGDTVVVEAFHYGGALLNLQRRGLNIVGVELDGDGMRTDRLEQELALLRGRRVVPKFILITPTMQNPTGSVMPVERRQELLRLSREYGVPILEDTCYAQLHEGPMVPHVRGLDDSNRVILVGSFSKWLSVSVRLGDVVCHWDLMTRLLPLKLDLGTGILEQMAVAEFCKRHYAAHLQRILAGYRRKREIAFAALRRHFGATVSFVDPRGGMFVWVKLPAGVDSRKYVLPALEQGVSFNQGPPWAVRPEDGVGFCRLCVVYPTDEEIEEGIARLARVFQLAGGEPVSRRTSVFS